MRQAQTLTDFRVLNITSKAFKPNGSIPSRYTCEGEDINPPLEIAGIPDKARSLALIMEDPDVSGEPWLHWIAWNIPVTHHIREDEVPGDQGLNDFGNTDYAGPCPASGAHRYVFKIYALDALINLPEGSLRKDVEEEMRDHIVAYGELAGIYKKYGKQRKVA